MLFLNMSDGWGRGQGLERLAVHVSSKISELWHQWVSRFIGIDLVKKTFTC